MINFIKQNWFKICILLIIAFAIFQYFNFKDRERTDKMLKDNMEQARIAEEKKKEYAADRRKECLDIWQAESKKWNNVQSWAYYEYKDECEITYKLPVSDRKSKQQCELEYNTCKESTSKDSFDTYCFMAELSCIDQTFTKTF